MPVTNSQAAVDDKAQAQKRCKNLKPAARPGDHLQLSQGKVSESAPVIHHPPAEKVVFVAQGGRDSEETNWV
jgi:hypothetical protein